MSRFSRAGKGILLLLAVALATGCDDTFEPLLENTEGPFALFGYLDLMADVQWVRVTPIRQGLIPDSAPIDAVVTLEHLESGRVVTLRDSLFEFVDTGVDGSAFAHNFWTTEPVEPESTYRLRAVRSDGAESSAVIETPPELTVDLRFGKAFSQDDSPRRVLRLAIIQAEKLLYADVLFTVWNQERGRGVSPYVESRLQGDTERGTWRISVPGVEQLQLLSVPPLVDVRRRELRVGVAGSDWPYEPDVDVGDVPSNVENGIGSVRGVATVTIPAMFCTPGAARADGTQDCTTRVDGSSVSVQGRVVPDPCAPPLQRPAVFLTERYADGGVVVWDWTTDWSGNYRFEGMEPTSELVLEVEGAAAGPLTIPALDPGERFIAPAVEMPSSC